MWANILQIIALASTFGVTTVGAAGIIGALQVGQENFAHAVALLGLVGAACTIVSLTWNAADKIARLRAASAGCREVGIEMDRLAAKINDLPDVGIRAELIDIATKLENVTAPVEEAGIGYSEKKNNRAYESAWRIVRAKYPRLGA